MAGRWLRSRQPDATTRLHLHLLDLA
eukprot:COSAG01_NODE_33965_length_555_cov_5.072368_2_plen_25_part_01